MYEFRNKNVGLAVTSVPLLAAAQLGQSDKLVANVPFQFRVGQKLIPAGQVVVQRGNSFGSALLVSNWEAKTSQYVLPRAKDKDTSARTRWCFTSTGTGTSSLEYGSREFRATTLCPKPRQKLKYGLRT